MRILYLGNFADPWSTEHEIAAALERAGQQVTRIDEQTADIGKFITTVTPHDWLLFAKGRLRGGWDHDPTSLIRGLQRLKDAGIVQRTACWVFDLLHPGFNPNRYSWAAGIAEAVDLFCTTDGSAAELLQPQARVLRQAGPPDHFSGIQDPRMTSQVLWLGGLYGERHDFVTALLRQLGNQLWIVPAGFRGPELAQVLHGTRLVIGPIWPYHAQYWSNRLYQVAAHGACLMTPTVPGMAEEGWREYQHYVPISTDPDEALATIESAVAGFLHRGETARRSLDWIGHQARRHCQQHHTYDHRIQTLLEWMR